MSPSQPLASFDGASIPLRASLAGVACVVAALSGVALAHGSLLAGLAAGSVIILCVTLVSANDARRLQQRIDAARDAAADLLRSGDVMAEPDYLAHLPSAGLAAGLAKLEAEVRGIVRAYRSLEVERESAQRLLERQSEEEATFFARLSHELRSPLNAILGYTSLLMDDAAEGGAASLGHDLARIRSAGQDLLTLIENLLDLGDERVGRLGAERAPFALADVFAEILSEYRQRANGAPMAVATRGGQQTLFGNRKRVQRAIASLLDDALRSRAMGTVRISGEPAVGSEEMVRIRLVASQPTSNGTAPGGGSGVGLQASRALATALGGSVAVDDSEPQRVTYTLDLPLDMRLNATVPKLESAMSTTPPPLESGTRPPGRTALVIDDDPAALDLLTRWLTRSGYRVLSAANAEGGLALACSALPDVILLDALMPGRSGYDVLPAMRANPKLAATPILIVTVDDDRDRGLNAGASDYVRKPVTETELRRLIATYETDQSGDVLIIDDDDDAADLLVRNVRRMGFTARRAGDGAEGLAALRQSTPRAILLDLNMPNLNGFDFIAHLSRDTRYATVPLIVVSGQDLSAEEHTTLLSAGCRFYLKGNATPREIAAGLREALA